MSTRITQAEYRVLLGQGRAKKHAPKRVITAKASAGRILRLEIFLPIVVVSELNQHEHWRGRHSRNKKQQEQFDFEYLALLGKVAIHPPCTIRLTRIGQNKMDSGNVEGSFKHVQDAIARLLGVDDGSPLLTGQYDQITGTPERNQD